MAKIACLFFGLCIIFSQAFACPDVSGIYRNSNDPRDKGVFWLMQTQCQTLRKTPGVIIDSGAANFGDTEYYPLDGSAVCKQASCQYVTAKNDVIVWKINFNGSVVIPGHGKCTHSGYQLSKMANGDLKAVFQVKDCTDRYQGLAEKTFSQL